MTPEEAIAVLSRAGSEYADEEMGMPGSEMQAEEQGIPVYWAIEKDATKFLDRLRDQVHRFYDYLTDTGLKARIDLSYSMYYSLLDRGQNSDSAITITGKDGEIRICEVNEFRQALRLLKTYITDHLPEWDTIATEGDSSTLEAAQAGNAILDATMDDVTKGVSTAISQAVEDAIVMSSGFVWNKWDETIGPESEVGPDGGMVRKGDYKYLTPGVYDVAFDPTIRDFREKRWLNVRCLENRWDLMAEFPEQAKQIYDIKPDYDSDYHEFEFQFGPAQHYSTNNDSLWVHYFFHLPTRACPLGRCVRHVGWELILHDYDGILDDGIPVHRLVPAQFQMTPFGFTSAFIAQAPQELLNGIISTLATNQNALGNVKIHKKGGEPINREVLEPGITVIDTDGELTPLNLLQSSPELYNSVPMYTQMVRGMVGTSNAAHGESKPSESGAARAFEEQRTQQGSKDFITAYDELLSSLGTSILRGYAKRLAEDDTRTMAGPPKSGRREEVELTPHVLKGIERVAITRGNPEMRTIAGRMRVAESLMTSGMATLTREEMVTVALTGDLTNLINSERAELDKVHRESDVLKMGGQHVVDPLDNHEFHIRRHAADAKREGRLGNITGNQASKAAVLEHLEMWMSPEGASMQAALGYNPGPAMGSMGPPQMTGAAQGGGGKPQEKPSTDSRPMLSGGGEENASKAKDNPALQNAA